jgi:hypothetical protein
MTKKKRGIIWKSKTLCSRPKSARSWLCDQKRKVGSSCKSWFSVLIFFSSFSRFSLASLRRATADVADCEGCGIEGKEGKPKSGSKSGSVLMAAGSDLTGAEDSRIVRFGGGRDISRSMLLHFLCEGLSERSEEYAVDDDVR